MIEITKERTKIESYTIYQAVDGTEFLDKDECAKYEKSAEGVLRGKLKPLIVNDKYDGWGLMGGNEDNKILAIAISNKSDIDIVLQNYYLDHPWLLKENGRVYRDKVINAVNQAYNEQDILLFGLNCDDELYFIDTRNNIVNRLNNLDKKEEQK